VTARDASVAIIGSPGGKAFHGFDVPRITDKDLPCVQQCKSRENGGSVHYCSE